MAAHRPESRRGQVRRILERRLTGGSLEPGGRLPSTRTLAHELGVSRSTVLAVVDVLVAEGYLESRPRSGLFATSPVRDRGVRQADPEAGGAWWRARLDRPSVRQSTHACPPAWWTAPYPFLTGQIHPSLFPQQAWSRAIRRSLDEEHRQWVLAEHGGDDPLLVEQICAHLLPSRGIDADPEQVVITMGSQQALALTARLLLGPGRTAVVEDPGYPDARAILADTGATVRPAPVDRDGLVLDPDGPAADLVHVTPSHQHPTNVTMGLPRRIEVLDRAAAWDAVTVEDDYDSELRYSGASSPSLASLDDRGRTVYLGTFSKFLSPGLRLGFLVADPALAAEVREQVRFTVRQVPGQIQRAMALFIRSGDYAMALARHRRHLSRRWKTACDAVQEHLPCTPGFPPGGSSVWLRSHQALDWAQIVEPAARRGVLLTPPDQHWARPEAPFHCVRLGFAAIAQDRIEPGIRELAAAIEQAGFTSG